MCPCVCVFSVCRCMHPFCLCACSSLSLCAHVSVSLGVHVTVCMYKFLCMCLSVCACAYNVCGCAYGPECIWMPGPCRCFPFQLRDGLPHWTWGSLLVDEGSSFTSQGLGHTTTLSFYRVLVVWTQLWTPHVRLESTLPTEPFASWRCSFFMCVGAGVPTASDQSLFIGILCLGVLRAP